MTSEVAAHPLDIAIVTGAGRGIGRVIALDLARHGTLVLCVSRSANATKTRDAIRTAGNRADAIEVDLAQYDVAGAAVSAWLEKQSGHRIGVALAAGSLGPSGPLWQTDLAEWDETWRANVLGNLAVSQGALRRMRTEHFGRILFFAGGGSAYAYPLFPAYAAVKTALVRATENLHEDVKDEGDFAVAIVAPGAVETDTLAQVRGKGGHVRTTVAMDEPLTFAREFLFAGCCGFSGSFVHVRDAWQPLLAGQGELARPDLWKLRRVE
jgi:NAD(P)-dependent dehydrogenase (short-subunit alcohol dehydrogenase family)